MSDTTEKLFKKCFLFMAIFFSILIFSFFATTIIRGQVREAEFNDIASKATAFYFDGNEVDPETIDPKFYKFSYDKDTGTVYLTKLDEKSSSFFIMPFVRPM